MIFLCGILFSCNGGRVNLNDQFEVKNGKIDLSGIDFTTTKPINLDGDWEFYWEKLFVAQDFYDSSHYQIKKYYPVPSEWTTSPEIPTLSKYGFGTYRVQIDLGKATSDIAIRLSSRGMAYKVIIDGKVMAESGSVGRDEEATIPQSKNDVIPLKFAKRNVELIIQTSNFHNHSGGLVGQIAIGDADSMVKSQNKNIWLDLFLAGSILMMGIYHIGLYVARKKDYSPLYFALFCIFMFVRILVSENISANLFSGFWVLLHKIDYLTYYLSFGSFFLYSIWIFKKDASKIITLVTIGFTIVFSILVVILSPGIYTHMLVVYQIFTLLAALYLTYLTVIAVIRKRNGALIYLLGWILLFAAGINDLLYFSGILNTQTVLPVGLFFFIFCQAILLVLRYEKYFRTNITLKNELNHVNKNLETIVEERTNSLRLANEDLAIFNEKMTDSISYAKRIQMAILPNEDEIKKVIPDFFTILKPRDIVSGDFYWFTHVENTPKGPISIIVLADCTGHGVPGAFMSMSGNAFLNQVVNVQQIYDPGQIAIAVNNIIEDTLQQDKKTDSNRDGMDAAICCIVHDKKEIEFAGANRPLMYMRNDELLKVSGAKASLGGNQSEIDPSSAFQTTKISFAESEIAVYLYSDGYTDQFGGYDNKKFGLNQLKKLINENATKPSEFQQSIFGFAINDWIANGKEEQTDDILLLGFKGGFS
ncbi:MAG: 7TM diverse intracellular signaling domain-containing protein [Bacteroidota bacterium]